MNKDTHNFVSRGGIKLQAALDKFRVDVKEKVVLDVGSSTGGFVDCLLQNGAAKVYAVDTAYGELAWKLRNDPRVVVMERTNILHLTHLPGEDVRWNRAHLEGGEVKDTSGGPAQSADGSLNDSPVGFDSPEVEKVDLVTIDAGWTKLELVLPVVKNFLKPGGFIIALLKPHYESGPKHLVKGIVPQHLVEEIKNSATRNIKGLGFKVGKVINSPILGGAGNKEFLLYLTL